MVANSNAQNTPYRPNPELMKLWPETSGNSINGLGDQDWHPPRPVFWRQDGSISHGEVLEYFYAKWRKNEFINSSRAVYDDIRVATVSDIAADKVEQSIPQWTRQVKEAALGFSAEKVGICAYRAQWTFGDRPQPRGKWAIVMGFAQDYDKMKLAPHVETYVEVIAQYARAGATAKRLANWIREQGHFAEARTGPNTEDVLMIPAAIESGIGELGKHGSLINRTLGSNFRLSMVLTDLPLAPDQRRDFGADAFCTNCQVCTQACPPDAIHTQKQMVRGEKKWYVDFDKCLPYFIEQKTCGICLAVCPWSRPGIADNLAAKMAKKMTASDAQA